MIYVVYFSDAGAPATGLTPAIDIYLKVSDGTSGGAAPSVTEIDGGFYKFSATPTEALIVRVDAGAGPGMADADRYKVMQITPYDDDLDAAVSSRGSQTDLTAVKAKTDNLPADPASNTQVNTRLAAAGYTAPDNAGIAAVKAKTDNLPASPANEANVEPHVAAALAAYDPPNRAEAASDRDAVLAALAALNDITVGEILSGDLSDSLSFPANSLADLVRKLFWVACNRMRITDATGAFTAYKSDGVTPAAQGNIADEGGITERSAPTWL